MQLKIWTPRPSELLLEVTRQYHLSQAEAEELVKQSSFNGLFVVFSRLSEAQKSMLESIATHLELQHERSQDVHLYDIRCYPNDDPHDMGAHDVEIDMWDFITSAYPRQYILICAKYSRIVQENSPDEALTNRILSIQQTLNKLSMIPEKERRPEDKKTIAQNEGYLERARQIFHHL